VCEADDELDGDDPLDNDAEGVPVDVTDGKVPLGVVVDVMDCDGVIDDVGDGAAADGVRVGVPLVVGVTVGSATDSAMPR